MARAFEFLRLCEELGVDEAKLRNINFLGMPGYDESMCLYEDDPEVQDFIERLRRQRPRIRLFLPRLYRPKYDTRPCNMAFRVLNVDAEGFVGPCCVIGTGRRWGNLFEEPDAWNGPTMQQARRNMQDPAFPLPPECLRCEEIILERPSIGG
jgi:radical SAM protein with 4Fe4S-binding SPASM domain